IDIRNWNTDTRTTAIVLAMISEIDSSNPLNANAVRWLMSNRTNGHWQGTQETAWTLMALTNWMKYSGELKANYHYAVALNGEKLGGGTADASTLREVTTLEVDIEKLLVDEANRLVFARDEGEGTLYYSAYLNLSLPVEQIKALDKGIIVSRSYYAENDLKKPVTEAKWGDRLYARITVIVPHDLHYVVIDDPLPAGLEAVDQSLLTSPQSEVPAQLSWNELEKLGWGWWYFDHIEMQDERVTLSASYLPAGTYIYSYMVRAGTQGEYRVIPTSAYEFYFPEVYGRGEGSLFTVKP
ncbi:MAG: alpha-2-macroglobulin, partial [Anaerolineaceae bacterium]